MIDLSEKNIKKNMFLGILFKGMSIIISYLYVPVLLFYLGEVKYGVWTTILNILSWINYFDIGIGNGLRNKLTESLVGDDTAGNVSKYVSSAYIMLGSVILIVTIVASILCIFVDWNVVFGVKNFDEDLKIIMQLSIVFVAINFLLSMCKSILYALQKNSFVNLMDVCQQFIMLLCVMVVTKIETKSVLLVAVLYGLSNFIVVFVCNIKLCMDNNNFIPKVKCFSKKEAMETTSLGIMFFLVQISALILFTTDNLLISHFIGPAEVTSYSMVQKLFSIGTAVFAVLVAPYWSKTAGSKAQGDYNDIKTSIKKMYLLLCVGIIAVIVLNFIFQPVSDFWLKQKLDYPPGLIQLMSIYAIVYMWNCIYSQIANGLSLMNVVVPVAIIQGIINIPLSLLFLLHFQMGVVGVLLGTVLSTIVAAVIVPIYVHIEINKRIK